VRRVERKSRNDSGDETREDNNYRGWDRKEHKKRVQKC
jgi:hypothetical protein